MRAIASSASANLTAAAEKIQDDILDRLLVGRVTEVDVIGLRISFWLFRASNVLAKLGGIG